MSAAARDYRPPLLALRALGLGDLLTVIPALRALRRSFVDCRLILATPSAFHPLVRAADLADDLVDVDGLEPFHLRLPPEVAVNLHGRGPRSHRILRAVRPRRLLAFAHAEIDETFGLPEWNDHEHEAMRWCRLLRETGTACDPTDLTIPAPAVARFAPAIAAGATLLHPGAAAAARQWPAQRFTAVARHEMRAGRRVVITGSADERDRAEAIAVAAGVPRAHVLAGRTDVVALAGAVAVSTRVVAGDTGVAHLATALRRPSVVLFGPASPAEWGPILDEPLHRTLWAGRRGDPHGSDTDCGLLEISVRDVTIALESLPTEPPRIQDSRPYLQDAFSR